MMYLYYDGYTPEAFCFNECVWWAWWAQMCVVHAKIRGSTTSQANRGVQIITNLKYGQVIKAVIKGCA